MRYAKLQDGKLQYASNPIQINGEDIFTTDPIPYGYKPIRYTQPETPEGMIAVSDGWEETGTEIVQLWRYEVAPEEEADIEDYEEALNQLGVQI